MSDRVLFATQQDVPGGPDRTPQGFNGFPFRIYPGTRETGLGLPTSRVLFWLVKRWRVDIDNFPTGEDGGVTPVYLDAANSDDSTLLVSEKELLKAWSWGTGYWAEDDGMGGAASGRSLIMEPAFDPDTLAETARFTIKLFESQGEVIGEDGWDDSVTFGDDTDFLYNVTPWKYWPYRNIAGDPIYDEDTGAQINDPLG